MPKNLTLLRLAILQSGRTQREVANAIGMHESRLSLIVNGASCDEAAQSKIAAALELSVAEVFESESEAA